MEELRDTLNQNTVTSSLALKELLGSISLEPVTDKKSDFYYIVSDGDIKFKPYYIAHTKVRIGCTGGEGGIRTLEAGLNPPNRLAGGPFQPLKHLS